MTGKMEKPKKSISYCPFIYFFPARGKPQNNNKDFMDDA
jgi:hypothetical protein